MVDGICPFAEQRLVPQNIFAKGSINRVGFCDHTAGGYYATLRNIEFWKSQGFCTHFGISRKGEIVQLVNIFDRAWGQGRGSKGESIGPGSFVTWPPFATMNFENPNEYMISTEHEDVIGKDEDGKPIFAPNGIWTPEMYNADLRLKRWCVDEVKRVRNQNLLRFGIDSLAGHHMFDPVSRVECPGKTWRQTYRQQLYDSLIGAEIVRVEHRKSAAFLAKNSFNNGQDYNGVQHINAEIDFNLPPEAKFIEIEFLARNGYAIIRSGSGNECGKIGWGSAGQSREVCTIALSDTGPTGIKGGKWFSIEAPTEAHKLYLHDAQSIAYLT